MGERVRIRDLTDSRGNVTPESFCLLKRGILGFKSSPGSITHHFCVTASSSAPTSISPWLNCPNPRLHRRVHPPDEATQLVCSGSADDEDELGNQAVYWEEQRLRARKQSGKLGVKLEFYRSCFLSFFWNSLCDSSSSGSLVLERHI